MLISKLKKTSLLLGDLCLLILALFLTILIRYPHEATDKIFFAHLEIFWPIFLIWLLLSYINGLYSLKTAKSNKFLENTLRATFLSLLISIIILYLRPSGSNFAPKTNLLIFSLINFFLFLIWRRGINHLLSYNAPKINIGLIGNHQLLKELVPEINRNPALGYKIKFLMLLAGQNRPLETENNLTIFGAENNLEEIAAKNKIQLLILAPAGNQNEDLRKKLFACLPLGLSYATLTDFYEKITGKVPLDIIDQDWFLKNLNLGDKKIFETVKRAMDLTLAILIFLISLPFWPLVALAIKSNSRGPILFRQTRLGKNNIPFTMIKFRTMRTEANNYSLTEAKDSRITKIGCWLRKTRIDEIPQTINIIKGQMSFVGPRPERLEFTAQLEKTIPYFSIRTLVKPGLSGWDQISGEYHSPSPTDTREKLQRDLFYIKNRSWYLDLTIILKTIKTVLVYEGR